MAGSSSENTPEFFTVFLPMYCSHQLEIPSAFKPNLKEEVTGEAIIERSATNQIWKVDLVKEDCRFLFKNGWKQFTTKNKMTVGEFMVFQYHGNSRFTVDLFGTDGLEKFTPAKQKTATVLDENNEDNVGGVTKRMNRMTISKKAAKKLKKESKKTPSSFSIRVTKHYINNRTLHLPRTFTREYIEGKGVPKIELVMEEKSWSVDVWSYRLSSRGDSFYMLGRGEFRDFARHSCVRNGDVCVFELLADRPSTTLAVSIIRAASNY